MAVFWAPRNLRICPCWLWFNQGIGLGLKFDLKHNKNTDKCGGASQESSSNLSIRILSGDGNGRKGGKGDERAETAAGHGHEGDAAACPGRGLGRLNDLLHSHQGQAPSGLVGMMDWAEKR